MKYLGFILLFTFVLFSYQNCEIKNSEDGSYEIQEDIKNKVITSEPNDIKQIKIDSDIILDLEKEEVITSSERQQIDSIPWSELKRLSENVRICQGDFKLTTRKEADGEMISIGCAYQVPIYISFRGFDGEDSDSHKMQMFYPDASINHSRSPKYGCQLNHPADRKYLCDREKNNRLVEIVESLLY